MPKSPDEVLVDITQIVRDVVGDQTVQLRRETQAKDVKNWDSLNHLEIIIGVENHFRIKMNFAELEKITNVGQMCDCVARKLG